MNYLRGQLLIVAAGLITIGYLAAEQKQQPSPLEKLHTERIALLQQRVDLLQTIAEHGLIERSQLARPQIALLRAEAEHVNPEDRGTYLKQMLPHFDRLISVAQSKVNAPERPRNPGISTLPTKVEAKVELLLLQAERIGIEIEIEECASKSSN